MKATTIIETGKQFLVFTLNVDLPSHHCSIPSVTTHHSSELSWSQSAANTVYHEWDVPKSYNDYK